jgi:hypothetical protein
LHGTPQQDDWYIELTPYISEIIAAWDWKEGRWKILPFNGGLYDNINHNPLTMEVWAHVAAITTAEIREMQKKTMGEA